MGELSRGRFLPYPCLVIRSESLRISEDWCLPDPVRMSNWYVGDVLTMGERRVPLVFSNLKFGKLFFRANSDRLDSATWFCSAFDENWATSQMNSPLISSSSNIEYGSSEAPAVSCSSINRFVEIVIAIRVGLGWSVMSRWCGEFYWVIDLSKELKYVSVLWTAGRDLSLDIYKTSDWNQTSQKFRFWRGTVGWRCLGLGSWTELRSERSEWNKS